MSRIYLAARYSRREELCAYGDDLWTLGHTVTSRWLAGNHQVSDDGLLAEGTREERERFARDDWEDLAFRQHVHRVQRGAPFLVTAVAADTSNWGWPWRGASASLSSALPKMPSCVWSRLTGWTRGLGL